jgi:hypothetical protein
MKLRNGFVSNSSSSSFVIFGITDPKLAVKAYREALKLPESERKDLIVVYGDMSLTYQLRSKYGRPDVDEDYVASKTVYDGFDPEDPDVEVISSKADYPVRERKPEIDAFGVLVTEFEYGTSMKLPLSTVDKVYRRLEKFGINPEDVSLVTITEDN